jgi:hypothetical protein
VCVCVKIRKRQFYLVFCVYRLSDPNTLLFIRHWRFRPQRKYAPKRDKLQESRISAEFVSAPTPFLPYKGRYTLSVKMNDFTVCRHTWRKNWVNCAVLIGNSAGLRTVLSSRPSHTELSSSLRESHTNIQFSFSCSFLYTFKLNSLTWSLWSPYEGKLRRSRGTVFCKWQQVREESRMQTVVNKATITPLHSASHEITWQIGGKAPLIPNVCTSWLAVSFTSQL